MPNFHKKSLNLLSAPPGVQTVRNDTAVDVKKPPAWNSKVLSREKNSFANVSLKTVKDHASLHQSTLCRAFKPFINTL